MPSNPTGAEQIFASILGVSPDTVYNMDYGVQDANQLAAIQAANAAANRQAATNPITGQVDQALLDQANAEAAAGVAPAANVTGINTGSWLANLSDMLSGTYTGPLGLPGFTPPLGTPVPGDNPTTPIDWTSILETLALFAGLGIGGYFVFKAITD